MSALTVLVVGATGSIGVHVVEEALAQGHRVRALARDSSRTQNLSAEADIVIGDLTNADTLRDAVADIDAVVFAHGSHGGRGEAERVDYGAVRNVLTALGGRRVRVALMTAVGTTDRANEGHDWKRRAERLVRASGNAYAIARPGWFDYNSPDQRRIVMRQGDLYSTASPADGVIARDQIARVLVDSLRSDEADHTTFELVATAAPRNPTSRRSSVHCPRTRHSTAPWIRTTCPSTRNPKAFETTSTHSGAEPWGSSETHA